MLKLPSEQAKAEFQQLSACPPRDPGKYALRLLSILFTNDVLANSNCTPAEGRNLIDLNVLLAIKGRQSRQIATTCFMFVQCSYTAQVNYKYPVVDDEDEEERRWGDIVKKLNTKCRGCRKQLKLKHIAAEKENITDEH